MRQNKKKPYVEEVVKPCDHHGCSGNGGYRAPKSRDAIHDYYWFCLDHVKVYNKSWDYYTGMSTTQIEQHIRLDTVWERPSWPMGAWQKQESIIRERMEAMFGSNFHGYSSFSSNERKSSTDSKEGTAIKVMELSEPLDLAKIKAKYRELVKRYHPDANAGNKASEEKFKEINLAYTTLKAIYGN